MQDPVVPWWWKGHCSTDKATGDNIPKRLTECLALDVGSRIPGRSPGRGWAVRPQRCVRVGSERWETVRSLTVRVLQFERSCP